MSLSTLVKNLQNIMRNDAGINGDAQRIEQMVWILFLKIYDSKEEDWKLNRENYSFVIPEEFRWSNWAVNRNLTGEDLLNFVNDELFPYLKSIKINESTPIYKIIVKNVFEDTYNYMKDGILLREVINEIDGIDFTQYTERHAFNEIYETILKDLQSQRSSGEFYTPRALTDFMVKILKPKLTEKIADFACGTGGFLTSALNYLESQIKTTEDKKKYNNTVFGIEKKALPYLLCITNMLLHDIDEPNIFHNNSLNKNVEEYKETDCFDIILMNPPYGGNEKEDIKINFPLELSSSETSDLFIVLILYRLKQNGRVGIILPDSFLFGTDSIKISIKEKLMREYNLHTIIRLPHSVFAPYTSISTNILFFDKTGTTKETWFYRMDMPQGYKNFSKTKPIKLEHFNNVLEWYENPVEIVENGVNKAKNCTIEEIKSRNYNLDVCGFEHEEEEILEPIELINKYNTRKKELNSQIEEVLSQILNLLETT